MAEMQGGSVEALGLIYGRYCDRAYRVARSVDSAHADEAVQEGFVAIWGSKASYRPQRATAAPWLLTVVRHRAIDIARRHRRDDFHHDDDVGLEDRRSRDDVAGDAVKRDEVWRVLVVLAQLPEAQQEVIVLSFYGQLTQTEIAEQLDIPLGTVKGRMRLGLQKLRADLSTWPRTGVATGVAPAA